MVRLEIFDGQTYTIESDDTEEWLGLTMNGSGEGKGQLVLNGNLRLTDDPDPPDEPFPDRDSPLDFGPIDLPLSSISLQRMDVGLSIFLIGLMAVLLSAVSILRNYAAGVALMLAVFALVASGLLGIGLELFWALIGATVILLIVGMVVRW